MSKAKEHKPNNTEWYEKFLESVDDKILHLKDVRGTYLFDKVDERLLKYLYRHCIKEPWANHLMFGVLISADRSNDFQTIRHTIGVINVRLKDIFASFHLHTIFEFNIEEHMYKYLKGEIYREHSYNQRTELLIRYRSLAYVTKKWMTEKLSIKQQEYFKQFQFPMPSFDSKDFSFTKLAIEQAQNTRKSETDAIVPFLPEIRSEAHLRWNQIKRLRDACQKIIEKAKNDSLPLPVEFHYEEPERVGEHFFFRLWDKPSFVLHHKEQFSDTVVQQAEKGVSTYAEKNNQYFVEFIKAESIDDGSEAEGLWFIELIRQRVLGQWSQNILPEEEGKRRAFLSYWGYSDENGDSKPIPFQSNHKGVIGNSLFLSQYRNKSDGIFFEIEPFYVACTFGLLAVDILTTTGARINELLQINNTKECIHVKKVKDKLHYSFYAIPKGRDEAEEFFISKQTMEILQTVARMLKDHYKSEKIPSVLYRHERKHLFPEPKPYYFQYHHKAFTKYPLWSSIRFLLHGLRFETREGNPVTIKTHFFSHAFATEAVQRQKMPIDIVAKILHQRDTKVTAYYSEPTPSQIAESVGELHDVIASYVDIDDAIHRSPQELQKALDEYSEQVGVFNKVLGGTCVTNYVCPIKMACLGCKSKVPNPEQEHELVEVIEVAKDMEKRFKKMGLEIEVKKAKVMQKEAKVELNEIDSIKKYREDQKHEAVVRYNTYWD